MKLYFAYKGHGALFSTKASNGRVSTVACVTTTIISPAMQTARHWSTNMSNARTTEHIPVVVVVVVIAGTAQHSKAEHSNAVNVVFIVVVVVVNRDKSILMVVVSSRAAGRGGSQWRPALLTSTSTSISAATAAAPPTQPTPSLLVTAPHNYCEGANCWDLAWGTQFAENSWSQVGESRDCPTADGLCPRSGRPVHARD